MKNTLTVPVAIIIAGALIGGAVIFTNKGGASSNQPTTVKKEPTDIQIRSVSGSDHIIGNPAAPIVLVEYSDTECPFCKSFHSTLNRMVDEYGKDGTFAWVYRHFPLEGLHKKALKEAEATECAAELGGNEKFWAFTNMLYQTTKSNDSFDPAQLPIIAQNVGLNKSAFETCLASGKYTAKIKADIEEAAKNGGYGTPFSIIVLSKAPSKELKEFVVSNNTEILKRQPAGMSDVMGFSKDERKIFVSGAMPYEIMKALFDFILK